MVAINIVPEQDALVPNWFSRGGYTFDVLLGAETAAVARDYGLTAAPLNFLLDAEGKIVARYDGYEPGSEKQIEEKIKLLLGGSNP